MKKKTLLFSTLFALSTGCNQSKTSAKSVASQGDNLQDENACDALVRKINYPMITDSTDVDKIKKLRLCSTQAQGVEYTEGCFAHSFSGEVSDYDDDDRIAVQFNFVLTDGESKAIGMAFMDKKMVFKDQLDRAINAQDFFEDELIQNSEKSLEYGDIELECEDVTSSLMPKFRNMFD